MTVDQGLVDEVLRGSYLADAHADSLMWNRDLARRSEEGHLDLPRLLEAGVKLQCFTVVTRGMPFVDGFGLFARSRRWPAAARSSLWSRALWQIEQLERLASRSEFRLAIARSSADLARNQVIGSISAVLGIEGGHALEGDVERVATLWERGVRFMSLTHLGSNELGSTSFPLLPDTGLSALGREVLEAMAEVGMAADLAHASRRTAEAILAGPSLPVFCSHTALASAHPSWRNLSDEVAREVAGRGGVVCILFAPHFLGERGTLEDLARHLERALEVCGEEHVGLGSDFDGMIPLPAGMRDVRDLRAVCRILLERGLPRPIVEKVLGANLRRFLEGLMKADSGRPRTAPVIGMSGSE